MSNLITPISNEDFNNIINIKFNNIIDGFNSFSNTYMEFNNENKFIKALDHIFDINEGKLIIDFYKHKLDSNSINIIIKSLDPQDKKLFLDFFNLTTLDTNYYLVNSKKIIPLITKLNTREIFFISYYFFNIPITIWGNYNLKFPCFFENMHMNFYMDLFNHFH